MPHSGRKFRHGDHLRLAWLSTHGFHLPEAIDYVSNSIRRFAEHHGATNKYHETVTVAWVKLVATHDEPTLDDFLSANAARLSGPLLNEFWSLDVLRSDQARADWVPPDLRPLPERKMGECLKSGERSSA